MEYLHTSTYRYYSFPLVSNSIKLISLLTLICLVLLSGVFTPFPSGRKVLGITKTVKSNQTNQLTIPGKNPIETKTPYAMVFEQQIVAKEFISPTPQSVQPDNQGEWGVAKQIGPHTWTMKVQSDEVTATAHDIFDALNTYRQKRGRGTLVLDTNLVNFAQSRADLFAKNGKTDTHAGFQDFLNNQDGFNQLGFNSLGENSSFGYRLEGVHLIEWVYGGDKPHDDNQLNSEWTHVGIGVNGATTDLVFGGKKR